MSLHQLKSVQFNSIKNNVIFQFQVSNSGPCLTHFWNYVDCIFAYLHCSPDIHCTWLGSTLDYARPAWKQTYRAVMTQSLHQWNQGNQWDFIITEAPFAPCLEVQSYRIKGVSLEIFPWGLPALTTQLVALFLSLWVFWDWLPRLTLMLNGCFLKPLQSISSVCVPGMSSRNAFTTVFLNPLQICWEKKHVPFSFFFFFFFFWWPLCP